MFEGDGFEGSPFERAGADGEFVISGGGGKLWVEFWAAFAALAELQRGGRRVRLGGILGEDLGRYRCGYGLVVRVGPMGPRCWFGAHFLRVFFIRETRVQTELGVTPCSSQMRARSPYFGTPMARYFATAMEIVGSWFCPAACDFGFALSRGIESIVCRGMDAARALSRSVMVKMADFLAVRLGRTSGPDHARA